jgi:hypothetical protein
MRPPASTKSLLPNVAKLLLVARSSSRIRCVRKNGLSATNTAAMRSRLIVANTPLNSAGRCTAMGTSCSSKRGSGGLKRL